MKKILWYIIVAYSLTLTQSVQAHSLSLLLNKADSLTKKNSKEALPLLYQCNQWIKDGKSREDQRLHVYKLFSKYYLKQEELDSAFIYCNLRLEEASKQQEQDDIIYAKTDLGEIYGKKGNFKKAFTLLSEAREECQLIQNKSFKAHVLTNQAYLYHSFEKKEKSVELLKEALQIYQQQRDTINMSYLYNNIGILYKHLQKYQSAVLFLNKAYHLAIQAKDTLGMASSCNNMGITLLLAQDKKESLKYLLKSLSYYNQLQMEELSLYANLGHVYKEMGNIVESRNYLDKALEIAYTKKEPQKILSLLKEVSDFHKEIKDWQNALFYLNEYHLYKERIYKEELPDIIDRIQAEADLKIKEKTIHLLTEKNNFQTLYLKQKNILIIVLTTLLIVILFLAYTLHSRSKAENKRKELLMEQRLLRSQMNPHFFFNTLSTIQSFVIKNEGRLAGKYIAKFARLMREILENSTKSKIPLEKEISALENYLSLQQMRMNHKFEYFISFDDEINIHSIAIPPMLFQPFIENSIEHGLKHLTDKKGLLKIHFSLNKELLCVTIHDNGVGRKKAKEINLLLNRKHNSLGTKITHERLGLLTNDKRKKSTLKILDLYNENKIALGTQVRLTVLYDHC